MHSSPLRKGLTSGVPAGGKTTHPSRQFPYSHETLFELAVLTGFPFCFLLTFLSFPYEVNKYFKKKERCVALLFCLIYILEPKDSIFSPKQSCWPSSKNAFLYKIYKSLFYMLQIPGNSYQDVKVRVLFFFYPLSFSLRERKQKRNLSLHNGIPSFCLCSAGRSLVPLSGF